MVKQKIDIVLIRSQETENVVTLHRKSLLQDALQASNCRRVQKNSEGLSPS